jgi:hypothetical protein
VRKAQIKTNGIRDPAEWAREWGWISRRKALNIDLALRSLAAEIENAAEGDHAAAGWARDIRRISKRVAPPRRQVAS